MLDAGTTAMLAAVVFGGASVVCGVAGAARRGGAPIAAAGLMIVAMVDAMHANVGLPAPLWALGLAAGAMVLAARVRYFAGSSRARSVTPALHLAVGSFLVLGHADHSAAVSGMHHPSPGVAITVALGLAGVAILTLASARRYLARPGRPSIGAVGEACMLAQMLAMGALLLT